MEDGENQYADQVMDRYADEITEAVTDRVARYGDTLTDLAYAIGAQSDLSPDDFTRITAGLDATRLPGVSAPGFVVPASTARTATVQHYWRTRGVAGLSLQPSIFEKAFDERNMIGTDVSVSPPPGTATRWRAALRTRPFGTAQLSPHRVRTACCWRPGLQRAGVRDPGHIPGLGTHGNPPSFLKAWPPAPMPGPPPYG